MSENIKPRSVMLVELNLEEIDVLCHVLMQAILDAQKKAIGKGRSYGLNPNSILGVLYAKLAGVNAALMGKT